MSRSPNELLLEALVHLEMASAYASGHDLDRLVIDAICMRLSAGIEVLARLDPDTRASLFPGLARRCANLQQAELAAESPVVING